MKFIYRGQTANGLSFKFIDDNGVENDFGVFNMTKEVALNLEEYKADKRNVELLYETLTITDKTDYFEGVDVENEEEFTEACKKFLTEKKGMVF